MFPKNMSVYILSANFPKINNGTQRAKTEI